MRGPPTSPAFWGKLERDLQTEEVIEWHPLIDHCADVAACAAMLLSLPTWNRRLARLCGRGELDNVTRERLAVLAALHDLGKFNLGFQAKGRPDIGVTAGHVKEAVAAVGQPVLQHVEPLGDWGEGTTGLLVASICHHGRPYSYNLAGRFEPVLWGARHGLDPSEGVRTLISACRVWFPLAFESAAGSFPNDAGFEHAYAGLVMLADWMGSDRAVFPYANEVGGDRMAFARGAAKRFAVESWLGIDAGRRTEDAARDAFERVAKPGYSPRRAQAAMLDLPRHEEGSITVLEAETGSGKTEAALARFVSLFSAGAVDGMYFALPTRTAATQMYQRVLAAMQRGFAQAPPVVLAVPGYLRVDDVIGERKLPTFTVLWPDTDADRFRYRAWAGEGPKRYLAGSVVVGTIDQVLLSSLMIGHAHLRATALLRQFLVVDEVHASDAYMTRILEDVLARHIRAGGHALLLSATLGAETRSRLLHPHEHASPPSFDKAVTAPYPLISHRGAEQLPTTMAPDGTPRVVSIEAVPWLEHAEATAAAALEAARTGARVLVVKNTVADCLQVQQCLEDSARATGEEELLFSCADAIAPHHARYAKPDREALDKALEAEFGETRPTGGCVIVATQTVQQSLDLDADLLLSDLCPMDVLLQRIGRLHRHSRVRPAAFEDALARVVVPANRDLGVLLNEQGKARHHHGLGTVYPDLRVLEATWRLVESTARWKIPTMNRALVEGSIHSNALDGISTEGGPRWESHAQAMLGARRGEARQADLNLVDWTQPYSETTFPDSKDERILTRLGEGDRRVHFHESFESPFGSWVRELTIPGRWVLGAPSTEEHATAVTRLGEVTEFEFGGRKFVYDRCGLRRAKSKNEEQRTSDDDGP